MSGTGVAHVVVDGRTLTVEAVRRIAEERAPVGVLGSGDTPRPLAARGAPAGEPAGGAAHLIRSHSVGLGPHFAEDEARAVLAARLNSLAGECAGVRPEVTERLVAYLNRGITPAVPEIGSLGAAGDTLPLAHVAATLIGEGHVLGDGRREETAQVLRRLGTQPLRLSLTEGRALVGGASATTGVASLVVARALGQVRQAEIAAALMTEATGAAAGPSPARGDGFARPHRGRGDTAAGLRALLEGGRAAGVLPAGVPEVLGGVRHALYGAVDVLEAELNPARGADGHGRPVAPALHRVTGALRRLGELAGRRLDGLLHPRGGGEGLPSPAGPGHHGFAAVGCAVAALLAENRRSGRDVAGPGLLAARGARQVLENNHRILAVEFLAAAQAVDLRRCFDELGPAAQAAYDAVRALVPTLGVDRAMSGDIELVAAALSRGELLRAVGRYGGVVLR
ncbi:aromatic amino acid ammonia-lyase [Streptomyces sp. NBC_00249]|uniref:aromatic amino acid ammonia-lyase n=1 Tax=Streptomyces sp. NBC_00249 TaxID=2975690 RepID=UPI00224D3E20|nr:aromatic amino acid ammonia-lyase [Streptomyces sp. NBC_00249]MCX5199537.1 aromatic amino acid ammonia-lyase [Streptomyces sp. NBC_00249]